MSNPLSITGYSTALFSTWFFIESYGVLFDCGDGVINTLLQKSRKVKNVFVSHADRDHLTGLLQFNQLNGRKELAIHYPKDCGSFPAIAEFTSNFDPHTKDSNWVPIESGDSISIGKGVEVCALENGHVRKKNPPQCKSLSFSIQSTKQKLKPSFANLAGQEIAKLRSEKGDSYLFDEVTEVELSYSGDTPVANDNRFSNSRILIHESTFLTKDELQPEQKDRNLHSSLDQVMEMVADSAIETLVLSHFSSRYADEQIDEAVEKEKSRCNVKIPIQIVYPGRISNFVV